HDLAILEGPRLRFVGVAQQVVRLAVTRLHERPFDARGEARTAAPAQTRVLHERDDVGGRHAERLLERSIAAALLPPLKCDRVAVPKGLRQDRRLARMRLVRVSHESISTTREAAGPSPASPIR